MREASPMCPVQVANQTWWENVLLEHYGIQASLTPLDGEYDLNFAVHQDGRRTHVLKVMRPGCETSLIEVQCQALDHIAQHGPEVVVPRVVKARDGSRFVSTPDQDGEERLVWLITNLPGRVYAQTSPQTHSLLREIGATLAMMDRALEGFTHPALGRDIKWDLRRSGWIRDATDLIDGAGRREIVERIVAAFDDGLLGRLNALPTTAIHNDINDYNMLVDASTGESRLSGIIDFGDMIDAPVIAELAIAGAYAVLGQERPVAALAALVAGYDSVRPLSDEELALLFPLVLTRLAVSVTNSAIVKREKPDDPYVTISEQPAWAFLEANSSLAPDLVLACLRVACGRAGHPRSDAVMGWIESHRGRFASMFGRNLDGIPVIDLSVAGPASPRNPFDLDADDLDDAVAEAMGGADIALGRYGEPRLIYTGPEFRKAPYAGSHRRTVHIAVDVFVDAGIEVRAPLDGVVHAVELRTSPLDYGGVAVLEHTTPDGDRFYTLYGHLAADVVTRLAPGQTVIAGEVIALIGDRTENGGWTPHVHFQLGLTTLGRGADWPGVADPDESAGWMALYPNGAALLNLADEDTAAVTITTDTVLPQRRKRFAGNLKLSYRRPITLLRGYKQFLFDQDGRTYLDGYNNVPHVGHCHPRIVAAAERQNRLLNTNTRYLHPAQVEYADALTLRLPDELSVCFFVNSGSEANELALRLARAHTGAVDTIVMDSGYHGNTNTAIDISPYKFNGPGGRGAPDWVDVVPVADPYRGPYKGSDPEAGRKYADHVRAAVERIQARNRRVAAFICEIFPSVGGQIIPPPDYYRQAYSAIRSVGGVCIADEVQTGLGRIGTHQWGFETQGVVPDIVVLGKPMGNGHPIGAVVTTPAIAASFANGMEFFSTFGGSTLACVIGREVLRVVDEEALQEQALDVGTFMLDGLRELQKEHAVIGDVRGSGLFIGVELIKDHDTLEPAQRQASYIVNRLREHRILIGTDGPLDNVLKIRPPLCFTREDASHLLGRLSTVLREEPCRM
ncbi:aminotransferase class III-fold pyridoxal phosphate-dependent enzyme [Microvirga sp. HBU67558]|uniref:aminotransferase class III-fold pyridoxal phosphate-dependent enzyme n=1 Tax=Microvirga TaxID=186650 RepID=UPI001B368C1C|nr:MULTISPECIES: aminotransferase class III-fold pyridoxal phosphate-dependent enzyme [unclassified Microvirga]MBQ0824485.1 aminotransferase class III-fold pyridoxal phosphate-dependent enzyme [Microvirga sp. HBU67558]